MLYSGSDVIRDLEWVIFDEVHYINDAEVRSRRRGRASGSLPGALSRGHSAAPSTPGASLPLPPGGAP